MREDTQIEKKLQLEIRTLQLEIKKLQLEIRKLSRRLPTSKPTESTEDVELARISFRINEKDHRKCGMIFSELIYNVDKFAIEYSPLKVEYKVKYGSIDVVALILIPFGVSLAASR